MSYSISTLLTRNLHDVFGENDPTRRRTAIDEIFTEDCVFYEPRGVYRDRDKIDGLAGVIKATHPDFRYQPIAGPEELGNGGSNGYRAAPVRRQHAGTDSSFPGTAGLPPSICFSTSFPELGFAALRPSCGRSLENGLRFYGFLRLGVCVRGDPSGLSLLKHHYPYEAPAPIWRKQCRTGFQGKFASSRAPVAA
jgi:hypothetical protein